jgi:hypothetical protein
MAEQKSLRDIFPAVRKAREPGKTGRPDGPVPAPLPNTPKKRTISEMFEAKSPEPLSRGKRMVQMARQKALSSTPSRSPVPQSESPLRGSTQDPKKRKVTARRKLAGLFEPPDFDRESELIAGARNNDAKVRLYD